MAGLEEEWSTLVSDIHFKRYGDALQKLQTIMFSRDAGSMLTARLRVSELLRKTAFSYLKLMAQKSIQDKLNMLQFLLDAFTCTHDRESQLVVRYEALILREFDVRIGPQLNVYIDEWVCFAEDCLNNGFIPNAIKGFDKALLYLDSLNNANQMAEELCKCREKADAIREIRDLAQNMLSADSGMQYLKFYSLMFHFLRSQ
ncbi:protein DOUBLE-STRAND BREAK FORMATION [Cryptomeria japonica]|uniref:protein DOUBLE-STRAND BREAK FORMATION n=1 Tax=Cryptomeria japonica TaxID=3369 RepID=UPI0025AC37E8|nr:protein DOUBLE-STRAND BREAK FORMATION [Cryptomeria japonica]